MDAKATRREHDRPQSESERRRPESTREPPPVIGKTELFVSEESVGHVENFFRSSDVDRQNRIRKIDAAPPIVDPNEKWYGDGSSDSD